MPLFATNTNYNSRLEEIVQGLCESQPEQKAKLTRAIDAGHDKGVVATKIRDMDDAFQVYMVSLISLVIIYLNIRRSLYKTS
jgi:hypothetical protein